MSQEALDHEGSNYVICQTIARQPTSDNLISASTESRNFVISGSYSVLSVQSDLSVRPACLRIPKINIPNKIQQNRFFLDLLTPCLPKSVSAIPSIDALPQVARLMGFHSFPCLSHHAVLRNNRARLEGLCLALSGR